jgi:acetyl-CoA C-acetyltransferase
MPRTTSYEGANVVVGSGVDSITFQGGGGGGKDERITEMYPAFWMPMIDTADIVAARYNVSREYQDEYSLAIAARMAAAQAVRQVQGRDRPDEDEDEGRRQGHEGRKHRRLRRRPDECNRPDTTLEGLAKLSRSRARASSSPPATPASSPTAPPPSC